MEKFCILILFFAVTVHSRLLKLNVKYTPQDVKRKCIFGEVELDFDKKEYIDTDGNGYVFTFRMLLKKMKIEKYFINDKIDVKSAEEEIDGATYYLEDFNVVQGLTQTNLGNGKVDLSFLESSGKKNYHFIGTVDASKNAQEEQWILFQFKAVSVKK